MCRWLGRVCGCVILVGVVGALAVGSADATTLARRDTGGGLVHVTVEFKAWIPFDYVVDPLDPISVGFPSMFLPGPSTCPHDFGPRGVRYKAYRGDGHVSYPGSYRLFETVSFDYDPGDEDNGDLTDITSNLAAGATHLDEVYQYGNRGLHACNLVTKTATKVGTVTLQGSAADATGIILDIASSVPTQAGAPEVNGTIHIFSVLPFDGADSGPDGIDISYVTDLFPSYGVKVDFDGQTVGQPVINDASCIKPVTGPRGALNLARGLTSNTNIGDVDFWPDHDQIWALEISGPAPGRENSRKWVSPDARAKDGLCVGSPISQW
jgi:hypothetical protein